MVLIALTGLFVIRYGPRPRYVGMVVLLGAWGQFMALRHSALHLSRDIGQGFSAAFFGAHTYVWSWVIHLTVLVVIGALLLALRQIAPADAVPKPGRAGRFAMGLFVVVVAANALQAFASTGPPPFIGQGDPVRLSWNPRHWVWSFEELDPPQISLRGSWTVPKPDVSAVDADPAHSPLANLGDLAVAAWERVGVPLEGTLSGLARDPATGRFLAITDRFGVYLLDSTLTHVLHSVVIDPGFSVDLGPLTGAAFLGGDTLAVVGINKSWALLRPDSAATERAEWRHFLDTDGRMTELGLGRFATVRARQQYVRSLAFDSAAQELITVSVPSARQRRMVVSRFARSDMLLASEFVPRLATGLMLKPDRKLADYLVTGAAAAGGRLYAVSAAYSTLLVIDLGTKTVVAAYALPGLRRPVGVAVRGTELLVAQADGRIAVLARPVP
jgi:disulfide bond formation protein DsbB